MIRSERKLKSGKVSVTVHFEGHEAEVVLQRLAVGARVCVGLVE